MKILVTSLVDLKKSMHNRPHQFVKYLSKKHEISVISINDWWKGSQSDSISYSKDFSDIFDKIDYHYLTYKKVTPIAQEVIFKKNLKKLVNRDFDAHLNYNTLVSGNYVSKRIPTVFDLADDLDAMIRHSPQIPGVLRPIGAKIGDHFINSNIRQARKVTITTEGLKESFKIPKEKAVIIPNGVDLELFRNYGDTKEELGIEGFVVGYVGVLREWVNLEPVFGALSKLNREICMVVVGKEGNFNGNVELSRKYGVSDRVKFIGTVPYNQVPKYISAMDVCLIPFKSNAISNSALPLKLFEYMACEKPVISTEMPGVRIVAGNKLLYAENDSDYEAQIMALYENPKLRKDMGASGRLLVEENYEWKGIAETMERLLKNL
ncbi:glycosyltransferase [Candidatus Micrarchaeota archaeon]|jgi:glycosyltransferase involved in cell wall biosynthesis|nr:glycosyltransferase [Candidatus Micrarchaeota archaeon]